MGLFFLFPLGVVAAGIVLLVNTRFALAVGADAKSRLDTGKGLAFVGPLTWFIAACIGSLAVVALYWLMHYSSLRHATEFPGRS
jgi:hypothetical protein